MKKLLLLTFLFLAACMPGFPPVMNQGPPSDAPKEIKQGWDDGCQTGVNTYGNDIYKSFYGYKMDPAMINNKAYYETWHDAYNYCRHWMNSNLRNGYFGAEYSDDLRDTRTIKQDGGGAGLVPPFLGW